MAKKIIRLCYRKVIDASSSKQWDKYVFESTYTEFLMQAQFYNQEKKYSSFGELTHDHLFMAALAITIVAKLHQLTLCILALEVSARDVVKHQATFAQMAFCQRLLNARLTLQQAVHRLVAMRIDIDWPARAAKLTPPPPHGGFALRAAYRQSISALPPGFGSQRQVCCHR